MPTTTGTMPMSTKAGRKHKPSGAAARTPTLFARSLRLPSSTSALFIGNGSHRLQATGAPLSTARATDRPRAASDDTRSS